MTLMELFRIDEMARSREDAMWAVLDWAATQAGEFTIKDMYREWVKAGGGGDSASYQQFSTSINNYIYKYDPQSPIAKYRNPRYKFIRVGKTDKGSVPAPLQYVTRGHRGAGAQHVLCWRPGIAPMRQPVGPKSSLAPEGDPVGDVLDRLERKLGRPALKAAMQRWKQLGDLHKIGADIMADQQIKGRDKMLALQVAADSLVTKGSATQAQADDAEEEMGDEIGEPKRTPFSSGPEPTGFEDDEDQKTDPDAAPLGSQIGGPQDDADSNGSDENPSSEPQGTGDDTADGGQESDGDETPESDVSTDDTMRGFLVGTEDAGNEGTHIPVVIRYDDDDGATVEREGGDQVGPYEGFHLEVANGVLTQDAFDDLEEDGWSLVAADDGGQSDDADEVAPAESPEESQEPDDPSTDSDSNEGDREGNAAEGDFPPYLPDPDEEGDRYERAMFNLVDEGHALNPPRCGEEDPLWGQLKACKDSVEAHRTIKASGLPHGLHRYALIVARAIFENTGRDFDSGERKNEGRLASLYGIIESPLKEPVDFDQQDGLRRVFKWAGRSS